MGWSGGKTRKKLRLQIEVTSSLNVHYQEVEVGEGESINLKMTLTDSAPRWYRGTTPTHQDEAKDAIRQAEEAHMRGDAQPAQQPQHSLADEETRVLLDKWRTGMLSAAEVERDNGSTMIPFLERCREEQEPDIKPEQPGLEVGRSLRTRFLGAGWKRWLQTPEIARDYLQWRAGHLADDIVLLRYGEPTMQSFWYLLRAGRARLPTVAECGSEAEDDMPRACAGPAPAETEVDADTVLYPTHDTSEGNQVNNTGNGEGDARPDLEETVPMPGGS